MEKAGNFWALEIDDVETDVGKAWIVGVTVLLPAIRVNVYFEVGGNAAFFFPDQEDGVEEVGAGFVIPASGGFNFDGFAVGAF